MARIVVAVEAGVGNRFMDLSAMVGRPLPLRTQVGDVPIQAEARIAATAVLDGGRLAELELEFDETDPPSIMQLITAAALRNGWSVKDGGGALPVRRDDV